jgi:hypothetical protein
MSRPQFRFVLLIAAATTLACSDSESVAVSDSAAVAAPRSPAATQPAASVQDPKATAVAPTLPANVIKEASEVQSPEFLSLFTAPSDTVRVALRRLRLWDFIGVAKAGSGDPRTRIPANAATWTQVGGPKVTVENPATLQATVVIPTSAEGQLLTFRLEILNASGGRSMDVHVIPQRQP